MTMPNWWGAIAVLGFATGAPACHHGQGAVQDAPPPSGNTLVPLEVESHYWGDVVIFLVSGGSRERLGMVTAMSKGTFSFPYRRLTAGGSTQLYAYPIGGAPGVLTDPLQVQPGQTISWTLEGDLARSSLAVY